MKNKKTLWVIVAIVVVLLIIIAAAGSNNQNTQPTSTETQSSPVTQNNGVVSLADLAANPQAYSGKVITTKGTIIGIVAETVSQSQIDEGDYDAYLSDGGNAVSLIVYRNPTIKQVSLGDTVQITGKLDYYDHPTPDPTNSLANAQITIDDTGSISVTGKSDSVVSATVVAQKVSTLLSSEQGNITKAVASVSSTGSFNECMTEYTKVWNGLCSAAGSPNSCEALNDTVAIKSVNTSLSGLSKACFNKFTTSDPSSVSLLLKTLTDVSNNGGVSLVPISATYVK